MKNLHMWNLGQEDASPEFEISACPVAQGHQIFFWQPNIEEWLPLWQAVFKG